jgi:hypothetical protein
MTTTRLGLLAFVLSVLVVERTFAQGVDTIDVLALEAPADRRPPQLTLSGSRDRRESTGRELAHRRSEERLGARGAAREVSK